MKNRRSHYKTIKKKLNKCGGVFKAYSELQLRYGEKLDEDETILEIKANVVLEDSEVGNDFTSDFLCIKNDGTSMIRECVYKKNLLKPSTIRLLKKLRSIPFYIYNDL